MNFQDLDDPAIVHRMVVSTPDRPWGYFAPEKYLCGKYASLFGRATREDVNCMACIAASTEAP